MGVFRLLVVHRGGLAINLKVCYNVAVNTLQPNTGGDRQSEDNMNNPKKKQELFDNISNAIATAQGHGYRVVVASDPEGNNFNELNPIYLEYGNTKPLVIALGVYQNVDEDEIFRGGDKEPTS